MSVPSVHSWRANEQDIEHRTEYEKNGENIFLLGIQGFKKKNSFSDLVLSPYLFYPEKKRFD